MLMAIQRPLLATFPAYYVVLLAARVSSGLSYSCQKKIWQKENLIRS